MDNIHKALQILSIYNDSFGDFEKQLENNFTATCEVLKVQNLPHLTLFLKNEHDTSVRWKYVSLSFHILLSAQNNENVISVNYLHDIKTVFQFIISLGILPNLLPGVGIDINKRCKNSNRIPAENIPIQTQYYRLTGTVRGLIKCLQFSSLRNFIIANHFNDLFAALFQLCYAPIKKPTEINSTAESIPPADFVMTKAFYEEICNNREYFQKHLDKLLFKSYSPKVFQELMFFYGNISSPRWLKSSVYKILMTKLQLNDGVESLIKTLMDAESIDTGAKWKQCDILVKLIFTKPTNVAPDKYYSNICAQVLNLLRKIDRNGKPLNDYTLIVASCIKFLYKKDVNVCQNYLLGSVINTFTKYAGNVPNLINNVVESVNQNVLLIYYCFVENFGSFQLLPVAILTPIIGILFHFLIVLNKSVHKTLASNIKNIVIKYLGKSKETQQVFDSLLFETSSNKILHFNEHLEILVNKVNELEIKNTEVKVRIDPLTRSDCLLDVLQDKNAEQLIASACKYLLDLSSSSTESLKSNTDLLHLESGDFLVINDATERKLVAYHLLSNLIASTNFQINMQKNPEPILKFVESFLEYSVKNNVHMSENGDTESAQQMFLLLMIVNSVMQSQEKNHLLSEFKNLLEILNKISAETPNSEIKNLIAEIINCDTVENSNVAVNVKSDFDKALEDICDPLLPTRGHGLMCLASLIEKKDPEACAKKQYILNICQQHLKNDDSYIYLNTIKVLAALGDSFPDTVLNILTEEYSNGSKELFANDIETRIKIGEVLLRVVKTLGDIAPKYKSLLLNTFLAGVRDDDHLIRASSLSNLGEVCRVLGYKLGPVVTEVLSCIHAVITTDKAVETRRAAVSVIRYLFVGLEKETIVFLKEEILPIYRTLKHVYTSDPDDVTRLQAQLALEELNENVRDFIFPKVQLEKKIVMLN